jgi:heptosyltransferase III
MFYHLDNTKTLSKALIIHSGALGDCVLTLKLAAFLRDALNIRVVNFIGPGDYISFMPGRTAVNGIRNIHSLKIDKMFADPADFVIEEDDPLLKIFGGYDWIISFLGGTGSSFEANLAYLACCTSSPEIVMLSARGPMPGNAHISDFHIDELISLKKPSLEAMGIDDPYEIAAKAEALICPNLNDVQQGLSILQAADGVKHTNDNLAILCPGSGGLEKCWHIDNYIAAAKTLAAHGFEPLFLLGHVEFERFDTATISRLRAAAAVVSSLNIEQVVGLLSTAALYIGNDSGVSHISGAMQLPSIAIFGPTDPGTYKPVGSAAKAVRFDERDFKGFSKSSVDKVAAIAIDAVSGHKLPAFDVSI